MALPLCSSIRSVRLENFCKPIVSTSTHPDSLRLHTSINGALKQCLLPLRSGTTNSHSRDSKCRATSTADVRKSSFPSFLPVEIEDLDEDAAVQLAMRIERLPVQVAAQDKLATLTAVIRIDRNSSIRRIRSGLIIDFITYIFRISVVRRFCGFFYKKNIFLNDLNWSWILLSVNMLHLIDRQLNQPSPSWAAA